MLITPGTRARAFAASPWLLIALFAVLLGGCLQQQASSGPFPDFSEFQGEIIRDVSFAGELEVPRDSLIAVIQTRETRCRFAFLPFCIPFTNLGLEEHRLDLAELSLDVSRVQLYHRDHGFYGARVEPVVEPAPGEDGVTVQFFVDAGRQVVLDSLAISGTDTILNLEQIQASIPLEEGEPFGRADFLASADTIRQRLLRGGRVYADVLRNYSIDTIAGIAEAEFVALPGPLVLVDTIIVEGNERLSDSAIRQQLTFGEGDPLLANQLNQSQRNLYALAMINVASIRLDSDEPSGAEFEEATVRVQVVEAPQYAVDLTAGFGTVDCLRGGAQWTNRNFLGGGRTLNVSGSLARVGVGAPTDMGLGASVCKEIDESGFLQLPGGEEIRDYVDFSLAADFEQPSVLGTRNQIGVTLHSERFSEVNAYIRESVGGRLTVSRQLDVAPVGLSGTLEIDRGRTLSDPTRLCLGFDTCTDSDITRLTRYRWSNVLSLASVYDRSPPDGSAQSGYLLRGSADAASPLLGSDDDYIRLLGEASYYRPLKPGWILATNVTLGEFLSRGGDQYVPPERRFYAGGPNSVRGYSRNALGPTTHIIREVFDDNGARSEEFFSSATGGTRMITTSVELRMPSPFLPDLVRLAAFVDAGNVSDPNTDIVPRSGLRVTPGAGVRLVTPVGPFRLDVAYNPYGAEVGPLYQADFDSGLILQRKSFEPEISALEHFRIQFALGQAF